MRIAGWTSYSHFVLTHTGDIVAKNSTPESAPESFLRSLCRLKSLDAAKEESDSSLSLKRALTLKDLTALGIAAVVGAGIFSTIGNAVFYGGPGAILLFIFTAVACGFAALCYAEFASLVPISGSAYTYAYVVFGELTAWVIGWTLLLEYSISNIAVAISWSRYFCHFLESYGVYIPEYLTIDFLSALRANNHVMTLLQEGQALPHLLSNLPGDIIRGYHAWQSAPALSGLRIICDLPSLMITTFITVVVYVGITHSKLVANIMVILKIALVLLVVAVGATYIDPDNWSPFLPNGFSGVLKSVSAVFFAFIGFDAIATTAEECRNPGRDIPRGMILSLALCTLLYVLVALVLTGAVHHSKLGVGDPLAYVFGPAGLNIRWVSVLMGAGGVIALTSVLLVYQIGQPRIWMAMSRDGLLPKVFAKLHPKYKTPAFSTVLTGILVAVPSLFLNLTEVTDLASTGTLFAFAVVCFGILRLDQVNPNRKATFRVPYIDSRFLFTPLMGFITFAALLGTQTEEGVLLKVAFSKPLTVLYMIEILVLCCFSIKRRLSLIPLLGLTSVSYLISELGLASCIGFGLWLILGVVLYFSYGYFHSNLRKN